ncbi:MAG: GNAT family N-acetyltransferase [Gemmatimonadaceae bacterium]
MRAGASPQKAEVELTFEPLTPDRWPDVVKLFGPRGACAGCWCMFWRRPRAEWERGKGSGNRAAFHRVVRKGPPPGILAYAEREPVGWCAVAPREAYVHLQRSRVLKPIDAEPVWSVSCLFVARAWRRHGLSVALLRAAGEFAAGRGARIVEGYPVDPYSGTMPDAFAWTGTVAAFRAAGFLEAARGSAKRPIMRRIVAPPGATLSAISYQ